MQFDIRNCHVKQRVNIRSYRKFAYSITRPRGRNNAIKLDSDRIDDSIQCVHIYIYIISTLPTHILSLSNCWVRTCFNVTIYILKCYNITKYEFVPHHYELRNFLLSWYLRNHLASATELIFEQNLKCVYSRWAKQYRVTTWNCYLCCTFSYDIWKCTVHCTVHVHCVYCMRQYRNDFLIIIIDCDMMLIPIK